MIRTQLPEIDYSKVSDEVWNRAVILKAEKGLYSTREALSLLYLRSDESVSQSKEELLTPVVIQTIKSSEEKPLLKEVAEKCESPLLHAVPQISSSPQLSLLRWG
jgi:hypothetical protein